VILSLDATDLAWAEHKWPQMKLGLGKTIDVTAKVGVIKANFSVELSVKAGDLVMNITSAKLAGFNLFGGVRGVIEGQVIKLAGHYGNLLSIGKNRDGNLSLRIPGFTFTQASIEAGIIKLEADLA
jgi:hypothetical protein